MDKILVVDDEIDTLNLAKIILERNNFQVISANNGEDALQKAGNESPDLILLDMVMPGKSGLEVSKILKTQQKTKHIPVVIFTVLGRDVDRQLSKNAGADAHLLKPFTPEGLVSEIKKHLETIRPEKFSNLLNIDHAKLRGKKILLEFDPVTPYERVVRDFVLECLIHNEAVILMGNKASVIYHALQEEEGLEFIPLIPKPILTPVLERNIGSLITFVCDNLTDLIFSMGFQASYKYIKHTLERINTPMATGLFILNPNAHAQNETYSIRSLFSEQVAYGSEGLVKIKLT